MKLKLIIFLMVFSMLFIACDDDTKPKADTYTLSGQLDVDDIGVTINNTPVYVRIYSSSVSLDGICSTSETPLYTKSSQFAGSVVLLDYSVSGISEGTYNFCVLVDEDNNGILSGSDGFHAASITINSNTTYDISGEAWDTW